MSTNEMPLDGQRYKIGKLSPMDAFHVMRRLMPVTQAMGIGMAQIKAVAGQKLTELDFAAGFGPASEALARMTDADANYVIAKCLLVVDRRDSDRWAPVHNGQSLQYQDIEMSAMLKLVMAVIKENLGGFFGGLLGSGEA